MPVVVELELQFIQLQEELVELVVVVMVVRLLMA
jgi:hypothetical protein